MIFLSHPDLPVIEQYLPTEKLAFMSSLNGAEQVFLYQALNKHSAFTHLVFSQVFENCIFLNEIGQWLGNLPALRYLSVVNTAGLAIEHIELFFVGLAKSKTLEFLDVSGLNLGPEGAQYLSVAIKQLNIKKLHARNNNFQAQGMFYLLQCSSLISINISNNNVHPRRWVKVLRKASTNLQKIILHDNGFTENGFCAFLKYILKIKLIYLDLSYCALSAKQISLFCLHMVNYPWLRILKLHNCNLFENSVTDFARMLRTNTRLLDVNINENPINLNGVLKLVWALQKNYTLQSLHIDQIEGTMVCNEKDNMLRLQPTLGESLNAYILRLICTNQDLQLAKVCWHPKLHSCYPAQSQKLVIFLLIVFSKFSPLPIELQQYILCFWMGHDLL